MPVQDAPISITPYQSTVPLVQLPVSQSDAATRPAAPLPGMFTKRSTGGLAIGDAIVKGLLQGREIKEQRKNAQAQATIAAADAAESGAYQKYQDVLAQAGPRPPDEQAAQAWDAKVKPAYDAYLGVFNQAKEAKAKFVIGDPQTGQKKAGEKGKDKSKFPGFSNIKEFMEANPHIVPQLAIMTMQPKPPGMTQQTQAQTLDLQTAQKRDKEADFALQEQQRKQNAQKIYDMYSGLSAEEFAKLPKKVQQQFEAAKNVLFPPVHKGSPRLFVMPDGKVKYAYVGEEPEGAEPLVAGMQGKPGSDVDYLQRYARENGLTIAELTTADLDYVAKRQAYDKALSSSTSTSTFIGRDGNTTTTSRTPGEAPQPPAGRKAVVVNDAGSGSSDTSRFMAIPNPKGLVEPGNIPIGNRPIVKNADGSQSTEFSISIGTDKGEVLIPTVVDGKFLTPDGKIRRKGEPGYEEMVAAAAKHYRDTGENLGTFKSVADADAYAEVLHNRGSKSPQARGGITRAPAAGQPRTITSAPGRGPSKYVTEQTTKALTEKTSAYGKAEEAYNKVMNDPNATDQQKSKALADRNMAWAAAEKDYNQKILSMGGSLGLSVSTPQGKRYTFKDQASADAYRRELGVL